MGMTPFKVRLKQHLKRINKKELLKRWKKIEKEQNFSQFQVDAKI